MMYPIAVFPGMLLLLLSPAQAFFLPGTGTTKVPVARTTREKFQKTVNKGNKAAVLPVFQDFSRNIQLRSSATSASAGEEPDFSSSESSSAQENKQTPPDTSSSVAAATFSLIKAILGSGVLTLPAGLAATSDYTGILWPGNALICVLGGLSAYTFNLYGRLTHATQAKSLGEMWDRIQYRTVTKPENAISVISIANVVYCLGCCLAFLLVIGDTVTGLLSAVTTSARWWAGRQTAILVAASTTLWPLINLPSLKALAPVSLIGVVGCMLVTAFMGWRCPAVFHSSPYAPGGALAEAGSLFATYNRFRGPAPLIVVALACVAFMAHVAAPDFYHSLRPTTDSSTDTSVTGTTTATNSTADTSVHSKAMIKYTLTTVLAFAATTIVNALIMTFGFLTFGNKSKGIVLNNYAAGDWGAFLSRMLIVTSVIGGFPFIFGAARASMMDLVAKNSKKSKKQQEFRMNLLMLPLLMAISLVVKDAGFAIALNGALIGSALIYTFPALLFLKLTNKQQISWRTKAERWFCSFLVAFGGLSSVIGAATTIISSYFPHLLQ